jgi:hypothetical protein
VTAWLQDPDVTHKMRNIVELMLIAGGPSVMPARVSWPLHAALKELRDDAGRRGLRRLHRSLTIRACPDVMTRADGVERALFALLQEGVLQPEGTGRKAALRLNPDSVAPLRRALMRLEPQEAELIQRAATRWAALVATSSKNRSTATESSGDPSSPAPSSTRSPAQPPPTSSPATTAATQSASSSTSSISRLPPNAYSS